MTVTENTAQENDFYREIRKKIQAWAKTEEGKNNQFTEYLLVAPDLIHLLIKLSFDKEIPAEEKAKLAVTIAYFISPVDLMPEAVLGPIGYLDDIALAAYTLNSIINKTDPEIVRRHWAGEGDVLDVVKHILEVADDMIGKGLWNRLKGLF
jgi:uncharacterized membrane protein YkvA (DUF1232 family)